MHVYLTARGFDLSDRIRGYVEQRIIEPLRTHTSLQITRSEVQLELETHRGNLVACHILVELKGHHDINVREVAGDVYAAIDLAQERAIVALTEHRDRLLTLARHPKNHGAAKVGA